MLACLSMSQENPQERAQIPKVGFCEEKNRLQGVFLRAIRELNALLSEQTKAVIEGEPDFSRFDVLLHFAHEKKEMAKYAWIAHVESHHCEEG
jgi:hypothetical protein